MSNVKGRRKVERTELNVGGHMQHPTLFMHTDNLFQRALQALGSNSFYATYSSSHELPP